jgi:hypothetical protein
MPRDLPRDTPLDTPVARQPTEALIEAPQLGPDAAQAGAQALARARSVETMEVVYEAWLELKRAHATAQRRWREEQERLRQQGALLLGAVKAASATPAVQEDAALLASSTLDAFVVEAREKFSAAERELEERVRVADEAFRAQLGLVRRELVERVRRHAAALRPRFELAVRALPGDRRILHARRLGLDESVVALFALTGKAPSRYDYLLDDSTDDVLAAPSVFYAEEGVVDVRPSAQALLATLREGPPDLLPVKGMIPLALPGGGAMRWVSRGAVLEAEVLDGDAFRNVLTAAEAEQVTGLLLAHRLAGRIELELVRD